MKRSGLNQALGLPAFAAVFLMLWAWAVPHAGAQVLSPDPDVEVDVDFDFDPDDSPLAVEDEVVAPPLPPGIEPPSPMAKIESDFANLLHFGLVGQFEVAEAYGQALLTNPELNPLTQDAAEHLLALSLKYQNSIEVLLLMINNTPLADTASRVLELVQDAHRRARMAPGRIIDNIRLLAGTPMQQAVGLERLVESGEYAVPWMLEVLEKPAESRLHPFVIRALPLLGKKALNPLVEALSIPDPAIQGVLAQVLGRIGYPQALPYLQRLATDSQANPAVRTAAADAIQQIVVADPSVKRLAADELFRDLAEKYYDNIESLQADPREERANVWFLRQGFLIPIEVPREIHHLVMAMRAAEAALELNSEQPDVVALWLAANFRREAALGLDVASEEPAETLDLTRQNFPRSIYFARTSGPMYNQLALARAIRTLDSAVALGAIAALDVTAGPAAMVDTAGPQTASLAAALSFPDRLVRIRAALALSRALPQQPFRDAREVVPVLASALQLTGEKYYMVVDPQEASREQLARDLRQTGAEVVAGADFPGALSSARQQVSHLDGIFLASDFRRPGPIEALRELAADTQFALAPVVLMVKPEDNLLLDRVLQLDQRIGFVFVVPEDGSPPGQITGQVLSRLEQVTPRYGAPALTTEQSVGLALEAARALRLIAVNQSPVFDLSAAERPLIAALGHPSEELRVAAAAALAMLPTASAQEAIARLALSEEQDEPLRQAVFAELAESARRFGPQLSEPTTRRLVEQATNEPNLTLRTAASQAMGAMNLPGRPVVQVILGQPRG